MCITCLTKRDIVRPNSNTLLLPTPRKTFVLTMNATKLAYAIRRKARSPANLSGNRSVVTIAVVFVLPLDNFFMILAGVKWL